MPFVKSKLPEACGSREQQQAPPSLLYACIMPIPSLRHGVVLFKICYNAVIVLSCALSCAMRLLQTNQHLSRLSFLQQWVGSGAASLSAAHVRKM